MLLEDFNRDSVKKFRKINKLLKEQFSITLSAGLGKSELAKSQKQVSEEIHRLKNNGKISNNCPELARNLLMLKGINALLERQQVNELHSNFSSSSSYIRVIDWLSDFIAKNVELGDDMEDAANQAMKEYRSSKWRFPDDFVRFDAIKKATEKLQQHI